MHTARELCVPKHRIDNLYSRKEENKMERENNDNKARKKEENKNDKSERKRALSRVFKTGWYKLTFTNRQN